MDKLDELFERQLKLQREKMGVDPATVSGDERYKYLLNNLFALVDEVTEAAAESNWKMWTETEHGAFHDRDAFVKELVDCVHFVLNLLLLADCDANELYDRFVVKNQVNADRQDQGYDGRSTKDATGRATDEPELETDNDSAQ